MKRSFIVTIDFKKGFPTREETLDYIQEAVQSWGGQYHPDDTFFTSNKTVRVTHRSPEKRHKLKETTHAHHDQRILAQDT